MAKTILYLNHSYCTSVPDVKCYLENGISNKEMQQEVLAVFKDGILTNWLDEKGEHEIAVRLESIPEGLTDSKLLSQICEVLVESHVMEKDKATIDLGFDWKEHVSLVSIYYIPHGEDNKIPLAESSILVEQNIEYIKVFFELKIIRPCNEELNFALYNLSNNEVEKKINLSLNATKNSIKEISFDLNTLDLKIDDCKEYRFALNEKDIYPIFISKMNSDISNYMVKKGMFEMIRVPAGDFTMGSYRGKSDEIPIHLVYLSSFLIGRYPVTQQLWQRVMGSNPSTFKGENLPVHNVSWFDCVFFCNRLSLYEGLEECYSINEDSVSILPHKHGYRLPTEAEWECAARGGKNIIAMSMYSGSSSLKDVGWYNENSNGKYHPVGLLKPNEFDICDMNGNVCEWCWDWYDRYPALSCVDPLGPNNGRYRVSRGGSQRDDASNCRISCRNYSLPGRKSDYLGLRLVCIPK